MVMNALPGLAPAGMSITEAPAFSEFPLYNADLQESSGFPPAVQRLAEAVRAADGVIFNSPEYNFSIPGGLKNAIDWVPGAQPAVRRQAGRATIRRERNARRRPHAVRSAPG